MRAAAATAILVCLAACSAAHELPDGGVGGVDAVARDVESPRPDAADAGPSDATLDAAPDAHATPDAGGDAACADLDDDGFLDGACGGDDCDDTLPDVHPGAERCVGPTSVERCVAGVLTVDDCAEPEPDCDARTGSCAESACGDAVVHPEEQCDDGDPATPDPCNYECRQVCYRGEICEPLAAVCIPRPMGEPACSNPIVGGMPNGAPCTTAETCASGWCDVRSGRCSTLCGALSDYCGPLPTLWCSIATSQLGSLPLELRPRCEAECAREDECPLASVCTLVRLTRSDDSVIIVSTCRDAWPGGEAFGSACGLGCASNNCVDRLCTHVCATDDDCAPPLARCLPYIPTAGSDAVARPVEWGAPWPTVCRP